MTSSTDPSGSHDKLDILIDQIGRLTEVVTTGFRDFRAELAEQRQEFRAELAELKALIQRQAEMVERQAEAARQQAEAAQQAATVRQQTEGIARLTAIAETLIRQRQS